MVSRRKSSSSSSGESSRSKSGHKEKDAKPAKRKSPKVERTNKRPLIAKKRNKDTPRSRSKSSSGKLAKAAKVESSASPDKKIKSRDRKRSLSANIKEKSRANESEKVKESGVPKSAGEKSKEPIEEKHDVLEKLNFGKNQFGQQYDCNLHIRICLNADRIKKLQLPKANTLKQKKLYDDNITAGLHIDWLKRRDRRTFKQLFDREDLKKLQVEETSKSKHQKSDEYKKDRGRHEKDVKQVVKVDPKSFEKFPDLDVPNTRTAKPTVKDRLGENHAVISHEVKAKPDAITGESAPPAIDPKYVPTTGRYFLHDDRENGDYHGHRRRNFSPIGGRRGGFLSRYERDDPRAGLNERRFPRKSSPDVWKHDKFGKESEDEAEEMQLPVTTEKERNTDRREGRGDDGLRRVGGDLRDRMNMRARDNREQRPDSPRRHRPADNQEESYLGQVPFYAQQNEDPAPTRRFGFNRTFSRSPPGRNRKQLTPHRERNARSPPNRNRNHEELNTQERVRRSRSPVNKGQRKSPSPDNMKSGKRFNPSPNRDNKKANSPGVNRDRKPISRERKELPASYRTRHSPSPSRRNPRRSRSRSYGRRRGAWRGFPGGRRPPAPPRDSDRRKAPSPRRRRSRTKSNSSSSSSSERDEKAKPSTIVRRSVSKQRKSSKSSSGSSSSSRSKSRDQKQKQEQSANNKSPEKIDLTSNKKVETAKLESPEKNSGIENHTSEIDSTKKVSIPETEPQKVESNISEREVIKNDSNDTKPDEKETSAQKKRKGKITSYENEDDLIEQSRATLAAIDSTGASKALGNLDIDLLNKLTQNG